MFRRKRLRPFLELRIHKTLEKPYRFRALGVQLHYKGFKNAWSHSISTQLSFLRAILWENPSGWLLTHKLYLLCRSWKSLSHAKFRKSLNSCTKFRSISSTSADLSKNIRYHQHHFVIISVNIFVKPTKIRTFFCTTIARIQIEFKLKLFCVRFEKKKIYVLNMPKVPNKDTRKKSTGVILMSLIMLDASHNLAPLYNSKNVKNTHERV